MILDALLTDTVDNLKTVTFCKMILIILYNPLYRIIIINTTLPNSILAVFLLPLIELLAVLFFRLRLSMEQSFLVLG